LGNAFRNLFSAQTASGFHADPRCDGSLSHRSAIPIAPVEMDMEELDAILTYVGAMGAADLGNPLKHQ
jgi:hypothetical protein